MARKTVLVCDSCGTEVGEGKGATFRVTIPTRSSESGTGISARASILESLRSGLLAPG